MRGPDGVLLRTENVTRSFGSLEAVNSVSPTVHQGELRSIIGPGVRETKRHVDSKRHPTRGSSQIHEMNPTLSIFTATSVEACP